MNNRIIFLLLLLPIASSGQYLAKKSFHKDWFFNFKSKFYEDDSCIDLFSNIDSVDKYKKYVKLKWVNQKSFQPIIIIYDNSKLSQPTIMENIKMVFINKKRMLLIMNGSRIEKYIFEPSVNKKERTLYKLNLKKIN